MRACKILWLRATMGLGLLLLASGCVTLSDSNSPYYALIKDDCYGSATLGQGYRCVNGKWAPMPEPLARNQ